MRNSTLYMRNLTLIRAITELLAAKDWNKNDRTIILNTFCNLMDCSQDRLLEMLSSIH